MERYGKPEIFNTDQECQFTSTEFAGLLKGEGMRIGVDGKGSWRGMALVENQVCGGLHACIYESRDGRGEHRQIMRDCNLNPYGKIV